MDVNEGKPDPLQQIHARCGGVQQRISFESEPTIGFLELGKMLQIDL